MSESPQDTLLLFGKMLAKLFQWLCALAGGGVLLFVPVVLLVSQGMLPAFSGAGRSATIEASPVSVIAILTTMALILAALFLFFKKLGAIIKSVGEGDPFTPENATRLGAMAWLFLGVKILALVVAELRRYLVSLIDKDASGGWLDLSLYDLDALVIVIVLFILARVFRHGAAMREDLKGTV